MTIEQAEKMLCPFIIDTRIQLEEGSMVVEKAYYAQSCCKTNKCMAWETTTESIEKFKATRELTDDEINSYIEQGYRVVTFKGCHTKLYKEEPLNKADQQGYCRRLR